MWCSTCLGRRQVALCASDHTIGGGAGNRLIFEQNKTKTPALNFRAQRKSIVLCVCAIECDLVKSFESTFYRNASIH